MSAVQERRVGSRSLYSTLLSLLLRCAERVAHGCCAQPIVELYRRQGVPFIHFQVSELSHIAVIDSEFCSLAVALPLVAAPSHFCGCHSRCYTGPQVYSPLVCLHLSDTSDSDSGAAAC